MKGTEPVAVTGIGCICGAGENLSRCMENLFSGVRNPLPPKGFATDHSSPFPVFEVPLKLPSGENGGEILRTARLAVRAAGEALEDAGIAAGDLAGLRVGVCMGTTVGSAMNNESFYRAFKEGEHPPMDPIERFLRSNPAEAVSRHLGLAGPCQTVVNACASGTDAVGIGASWIRDGVCDMVIAGGADELCRVTYNGFSSLMITDTEPCRPFDAGRRGLNLGEGAAALVLVSGEAAGALKSRAKGYVCGYGSSCDAFHLTKPRPDGKGLIQAVDEAMAEGGVAAGDIAFVNAHGTGTSDNDRVESKVMAERLPGVPFFSTKGYTGHTLGAAGAVEAAFTLACLAKGKIPPSIGFGKKEPELAVSPVETVTDIHGDHALSQSLAFGGNNAVLLLRKA